MSSESSFGRAGRSSDFYERRNQSGVGSLELASPQKLIDFYDSLTVSDGVENPTSSADYQLAKMVLEDARELEMYKLRKNQGNNAYLGERLIEKLKNWKTAPSVTQGINHYIDNLIKDYESA
jgi:hypothetical protein